MNQHIIKREIKLDSIILFHQGLHNMLLLGQMLAMVNIYVQELEPGMQRNNFVQHTLYEVIRYSDWLLTQIDDADIKKSSANFYDWSFGVNSTINDKNT